MNLLKSLSLPTVSLVIGLLLVGCSSKPKLSTAVNTIKIETELAKLEMAKASLSSVQEEVTELTMNYRTQEPKLADLEVLKLSTYLNANDCEGLEVVDARCYQTLRGELIKTTYSLDKANERIYSLEVVNNQLLTLLQVTFNTLGLSPAKK